MTDNTGHLHKQVAQAEERLRGEKFCFSCNSHRTVEGGTLKVNPRGRGATWRCASCSNRANPSGFLSGKKRK